MSKECSSTQAKKERKKKVWKLNYKKNIMQIMLNRQVTNVDTNNRKTSLKLVSVSFDNKEKVPCFYSLILFSKKFFQDMCLKATFYYLTMYLFARSSYFNEPFVKAFLVF